MRHLVIRHSLIYGFALPASLILSLYCKAKVIDNKTQSIKSDTESTHITTALRIAVAANFKSTLTALTEDFNKINNQNINFKLSNGATGSLFTQIINGAPYDIFFSADTKRPTLLKNDNLGIEDSYFHYATGTLALVIKTRHSLLHTKQCPKDPSELANKALAHHKAIVIANPRTAPYGAAAIQFLNDTLKLQSQALPDQTKALTMQDLKIIRGKNIAHAQQLFTSTAANIALLSKTQIIDSTLLSEALQLKKILVCELSLSNNVLKQAAIVIKQPYRTPDQERAIQKFMAYLKESRAKNILLSNGYALP